MKYFNTFVVIIYIILSVSCNSRHESSNNTSNSQTETTSKQKCSICGITFSHRGFTEVTEGVWEECKEPYQCQICSPACGMKHTQKWDEINNKVNIPFGQACGLCGGTGIEKNTSKLLSNEYGRVCPMCNGTGRK